MKPSQPPPLIDPGAEESIAWRIRWGFYTSDEIVAAIAESITHEPSSGITLQTAKRAIRPVVVTEWQAQLEIQKSWPGESTVSDKLTRAFSSLERNHNILARMNFTCCQTCGVAEPSGDRDDHTRGYGFIHEQDTEHVVDGGDLCLTFGSFTKPDRKTRDVGGIIVRSLRRARLRVKWEMDPGKRTKVCCGEWRRGFQEDEEMKDVADDDFDSDCVRSGESESDPEPDTYLDLELDTETDT